MRPGPDLVIPVEGTFDPMAAAALRARLAELGSAGCVLDFSRAREVYDLGLALLADAVAARPGAPVRFRGLSQHHARMLRYLGVDGALYGSAGPAQA
jgi:hypothetical protein